MLSLDVCRRLKTRRGLSLIELVVVVLILGILATVALPRFVGQSDSARVNGTLQSLTVLRTAIDTFRVNNGSYPTAAALPTNTGILPLLRGQFPAPQVGATSGNNTVTSSASSPPAVVAGGGGWVYNSTTGEIAINDTAYISY